MGKILTQKEIAVRFNNPIMKNQVSGDQFIENEEGEVELKGNFLGEKKYVAFEEVAIEKTKTGKKILLNIGDSSTSGWDSDLVLITRELKSKNPKFKEIFPIFNYPTYSDLMRRKIKNRLIVLNAGVPTHTSLNGIRRLKKLVTLFEKRNIKIDYVTIYYGNNDCVCNDNVEEKYRDSKIMKAIGKVRTKIITRTSLPDFKKNIASLIALCNKNGITPILIEPVTPLYWEPGRRVKRKRFVHFDIEDKAVEQLRSHKKLHESYKQAIELWERGISEHKKWNIQKAIGLLEQAKELDFITPRIKQAYVNVLGKIASENKLPYVQISIPQENDDGRAGAAYFCDYCHPIEKANILLANEIIKRIKQLEKGRKNGSS
mgnify:CR=1 FL=1